MVPLLLASSASPFASPHSDRILHDSHTELPRSLLSSKLLIPPSSFLCAAWLGHPVALEDVPPRGNLPRSPGLANALMRTFWLLLHMYPPLLQLSPNLVICIPYQTISYMKVGTVPILITSVSPTYSWYSVYLLNECINLLIRLTNH